MASRSERATTCPSYRSRWLASSALIRPTATRQSTTPTDALNATVARILTAMGRSVNQRPRRRRAGAVRGAVISELRSGDVHAGHLGLQLSHGSQEWRIGP